MSIQANSKPSQTYHVPNDVLLEVFFRLPIKSLERFKSVSKEWNSMLLDSLFIQTNSTRRKGDVRLIFYHPKKLKFFAVEHRDLIMNHHEKDQKDQDRLSLLPTPCEFAEKPAPIFIGSYHGLVAALLEASRDRLKFGLWNPLTNKATSLWDFFPETILYPGRTLFGLCVPYSDFYSVVVVVMDLPSLAGYKTRIHVLNVKTGEQKKYIVPSIPDDRGYKSGNQVGTVVCGVVHWVVERFADDQPLPGQRDLLWLDMGKNKKFRKMEGPPGQVTRNMILSSLSSLDEGRQLCVTLQDRAQPCLFEVWVMKEYGNPDTWSNVFVTQGGMWKGVSSMTVVGFMENREYLLDVFRKIKSELWGFDQETGGLRVIINKKGRCGFTLIPNEPSLIFPDPKK